MSDRNEQGAPADGAPRSSYFGTLTRVLNVIGTLLILAMAVAVNADVIGRNAFNHPLPGVLEFLGLSIVAIVFLQMANTLREDRHVSNDLIMRAVATSRPKFAAFIYGIFNLVGAALMVLVVIYVWPILAETYRNGYFRGTAGVVEIPIWPFYTAIVFGAAATAVQFALFALREFQRAMRTTGPAR
ncbi:MAG: TRAP transporter small permease [Bradyrhizobiaceae bacterium]|nr:TRAP transporter small permease [Bradyrhizobiaceae bacterium]